MLSASESHRMRYAPGHDHEQHLSALKAFDRRLMLPLLCVALSQYDSPEGKRALGLCGLFTPRRVPALHIAWRFAAVRST